MGASHSVEATDTTVEDAIEDPPPEVEETETEEEAQLRINEEEMNWFWPFI